MTIPRVGLPKIVQCRRHDEGSRLCTCPPGGTAYDLVIYDLDTYEDLARSGATGWNGCYG